MIEFPSVLIRNCTSLVRLKNREMLLKTYDIWKDTIINEEIIYKIRIKRTLWKILGKRRAQMIGLMLRHGAR